MLLAIGQGYGMDAAETSTRYLQAALNLSQKADDKTTQMRLLFAISPQYERAGDYYRQLVDFEEKRVLLAREVGNRMVEGHAIMFCGQIKAIYLGDYEEGLALEEQAYELWEKTNSRLYPLLRIAQIQTLMGRYDEALETLERAQPIGEHHVDMLGRAGFALVTAILYNSLGDEAHLRRVLDVTELIRGMVADDRVSRQYAMAAACEATAARLCLGGFISTSQGAAGDPDERAEHLRLALESSSQALAIYETFGFTQVVECVAEEIFLRHSLALEASGQIEAAADYLRKAYEETQRKLALIPPESPYAQSFMAIKLHQEICARYEAAG
jgi:tetratricopeptide (TPR) repeat protein